MEPERARQAVRRTANAEKGTGDAVGEALGGAGLVSLGMALIVQAFASENTALAVVAVVVILLGLIYYIARRHYRDSRY